MDKLMPIELAYMAGYFDADGCIAANDNKRTGPGLYMFLFSNDQSALGLFQSAFGGRVKLERPAGKARYSGEHTARRDQYRWYGSHGAGLRCARALAPYLHLKRERALFYCEMWSLKRPRYVGSSRVSIPEDNRQRRRVILETVRAQNYGPHTGPNGDSPRVSIPKARMAQEEKLAYFAGYVDGDGHITGCNTKQAGPRLDVGVTSADLRIMPVLRKNFGGSFHDANARAREESWAKRTIYKWSIVAREAEQFLRLVLPYLRLKQQQAELFLEMQALKSPKHRGRGVPRENMQRRLAILDKIHSLNQRVLPSCSYVPGRMEEGLPGTFLHVERGLA